jgi:tRNA-splicing ligase RtcB (3'-phosphate/5'-hydroxy nucleic acid ligase)
LPLHAIRFADLRKFVKAMNTSQLRKLGIPDACLAEAAQGIQAAAREGRFKGSEAKRLMRAIVETPESHTGDPYFGALARALIEERQFVPAAPVGYRTWGTEIDGASHAQMRQACAVPVARAGALMPDAHVGYGLPIGGVLACENAVIPYAVGVDIACRMKLSILDISPASMTSRFDLFRRALEGGTRFGVGSVHERPQ